MQKILKREEKNRRNSAEDEFRSVSSLFVFSPRKQLPRETFLMHHLEKSSTLERANPLLAV